MKKSRTSSVPSVPGWYLAFQAAMLLQAPRPGEIDQELAMWLTGNQNILKKFLTDSFRAARKIFAEVITVIVDGSKSLSKMKRACGVVADGMYISYQNFSSNFTGKEKRHLFLVRGEDILAWVISNHPDVKKTNFFLWSKIEEYFFCHGLFSADLWDLLALGAARPELLQQFKIVALGDKYCDSVLSLRYPHLHLQGNERRLDLICETDHPDYASILFLAVLEK